MSENKRIADMLGRGKPVLSVEFFPPKDEAGGELIVRTAMEIRESLRPDFVSITYGAGGSTRERTLRYARILKDECGFAVMPHLTCVGSSREEIAEIVEGYAAEGFCNLMALRGDPPKGQTDFQPHPDGFAYANELVGFLSGRFPGFSMGVAGYPEVHPEATDAATDIRHLKAKVDAGAAFITTQLFYDNAAFFQFVENCRSAGIRVPIIPGLMPIRSAEQARRFCKTLPAELEDALQAAADEPAALREAGVAWCHRQIRELLDFGAAGIHLYIMNRSGMARDLIERLRQDGYFTA